jgi:exonuclease SbcD
MKIFHLSDLHIGKQLYFYNLRASQERVLQMIVEKAVEYRPDVVVIAGDIYDKAVPSGEAYELFDAFLNQLADIRPSIPVLIIAGNHDNAARLKFASGFLKKNHIYISVMPPQSEEEHLVKIELEDEFGLVNFYLLPFTKPAYVRKLFEEETCREYQDAVQKVIEREVLDETKRNVLVAHQFFVAGEEKPERSDSEMNLSVGGLDQVDIKCVEKFDYVALGHIHRAQKVGKDFIRYCGTPLKYSVSEEKHHKGILMITLGEKGSKNQYETIPLTIKPDVRSMRGTLEEVIALAKEENKDDYVSITLTDEELERPKDKLEEYYSRILEVRIDNKQTRAILSEDFEENSTDPVEAFFHFYEEMNGQPLGEEAEQIFYEVLETAVRRREREES